MSFALQLVLQLAIIIAAARLMGLLLRRLGQPPVVGEMFAGILLGPSVFGLFAPGLHAALFPPQSIPALGWVSQTGVILFLFAVGLDLELDVLRRRAMSAVLISLAGIVVPFALGASLALSLHSGLVPAGVPRPVFALFVAVAMSITAFPVLARILSDRGLTRTALGSTALGCAAIDDVIAWCLLATVLAVAAGGTTAGAARSLALVAAFSLVLLVGVRRYLAPALGRAPILIAAPVAVATAFLCAAVTDAIGVHALFGAFVAGATFSGVPLLRGRVREWIERLASLVLLPVFFALAGLRTEMTLVSSPSALFICAVIVGVAVAGKLGGVGLAARAAGYSPRAALSLGVLMNARGLMELIVLNIGYERGILPAELYAMMVIMALATTCMTGPLLSYIDPDPDHLTRPVGSP